MSAWPRSLAAAAARLVPQGIGARALLMLVLAAAIPVLLFGGWVVQLTARQQRDLDRRTAITTTAQVAERVGAGVARQIEALAALAVSTSLDGPDLAHFYVEASRLRAEHPLWETIELSDPSGAQVVNLLRSLGADLWPTADRASFDAVVRTHRPAVGGLGPVGSVSGRRLVALRVPVMRQDRLRYVLSVALATDSVGTILREAGIPAGWIGAIVDGAGTIIARTRGEASEAGRPASASLRAAIVRAPSGSYSGTTLEGARVETVYQTLSDTGGWSAHCGIPTEALDGPTLRSRALLAGGGLASLGLALALATLTARDLAQRRRDEAARMDRALRTSEEQGAVAAEAADLGTVRWDLGRGRVVGSERAGRLLGLDPAAPGPRTSGPGDPDWPMGAVLAAMHPEDRRGVEARLRAGAADGGPIDAEFRVVGAVGAPRRVRLTGRAPRLRGSEDAGLIFGVVADVEPARRAEAERAALFRRLAEAQENEQRRIARELHDQVGQTVTALSLGLKELEASAGDGDRGAERIRRLRALAGEVGRDIHRAALDLRPTALDDLGLYDALRALAGVWSERHGIPVDLQIHGGEDRLAAEVETALYRICQEALTNVAKHAGAARVDVVLERRRGEIRLVVEDDGAGFEPCGDGAPGQAATVPRLGLRGMRERLALLGGALTVEAAPGAGTTLFARIPAVDHPASPGSDP